MDNTGNKRSIVNDSELTITITSLIFSITVRWKNLFIKSTRKILSLFSSNADEKFFSISFGTWFGHKLILELGIFVVLFQFRNTDLDSKFQIGLFFFSFLTADRLCSLNAILLTHDYCYLLLIIMIR